MRIRLSALLLALFLLLPAAPPGNRRRHRRHTAPVAEFAQAITEGTGLTVTRLITDSVSCLTTTPSPSGRWRPWKRAGWCSSPARGWRTSWTTSSPTPRPWWTAPRALTCSRTARATDPHIWLDPARAQQMVDNLTAGLTAVYPEHEAAFAENATVLKARLQALDEEGKKSSLGHFLSGAHHLPRRLWLPGQSL